MLRQMRCLLLHKEPPTTTRNTPLLRNTHVLCRRKRTSYNANTACAMPAELEKQTRLQLDGRSVSATTERKWLRRRGETMRENWRENLRENWRENWCENWRENWCENWCEKLREFVGAPKFTPKFTPPFSRTSPTVSTHEFMHMC